MVAQAVTSLAHLLTEIENLRKKYDLKPQTGLRKVSNSFRACKSLTPSSSVTALRQRMQDNQKQKSILNLAKWVYSDAKMFEEKVYKLKSLIDGLESVYKSADTTSNRVSRPPSYTTAASDDMPPPYTTSESRRRTRAPRINTDIQSTESRPMSVFSPLYTGEFSKHYIAFKHLLAAATHQSRTIDSTARDKLTRLSDIQFKELRTDVYDDLIRRQKYHDLTGYLSADERYHSKRNEARKKLSTLPAHRFLDLVSDIAAEIERRLGPGAELRSSTGIHFAIPSLVNSQNITPTSSSPPTPLSPSPSAVHLSHLSHLSTTRLPSIPNQTYIPISPSSSTLHSPTPSLELNQTTAFQSFRVSPTSTTSTVLPAAMQKYGIQASWRDYSLWIMYGPGHIQELCLGLEDRPLSIFRRLEKEGRGPMFMLRRNA